MKAQEDLDRIFQQRLHNLEVPPPAFVWPAVEDELRKRRRRFALWLFFGGIMGAGLILGTWNWQRQHALVSRDANVSNVVHDANQQVITHTTPIADTPENLNAPENKTVTIPDVPASSGTESDPINTVLQKNKDDRAGNVKKVAGDTKTAFPITAGNNLNGKRGKPTPPARTTKDVQNQITNHQPLTLPTANTPTQIETRQPETAFAPEVKDDTLSSGNANTDATTAKIPTQNEIIVPSFNPVSTDAQIEKGDDFPLMLVLSPQCLVFIPKPTESSFKLDNKAQYLTIRKKKEPKNCYDFEKHRTVLLVDAFAGPTFTRKSLHADDPENADYLAERRNTERSDWAAHAGLRASLVFDRHFLLRAGVQYEQLTEIFEFAEYDYTRVKTVTTYVHGQVFIDTLGVVSGDHYVRTYNRLGLLDIPLQVGMELRSGRSGLSINAGASFNVLFWKRGAILTPQGQPAYFTPKDGSIDVFRKHIGLSAVASVQWFYHLKPRTRLFAEPYFRQVLRPVSVPNQPIEQRYAIWGVKLGVTKIID